MKRGTLRVLLLLPLLLTSLPPSAGGAQRTGLSLFEQSEKTEEIEKAEAPPESDAPYYVRTAVATVLTEGTCILGDLLGFSIGAVLRWPFWVVTLGDTFASTEDFDLAGNAILELACDAPWVLNVEYFKAIAPQRLDTRPSAPNSEEP